MTNGDTSDATDINAPLTDLETDMNTARPVVAGGTGSTTASAARTALGLAIGTDVQAYDAQLDDLAATTPAAAKILMADGSNWTAEDLVGTVSESSGTPTGAVIERGSGANGEYVRFADGTQICTFEVNSNSGSDVTWTYPAAFTVAPVVTGVGVGADRVFANGATSPGATSCVFRLWIMQASPARSTSGTDLLAIGRWF